MPSNIKCKPVGSDSSAQSSAPISAFNAEFINTTYRQSLLHCSTTDIHVSKVPSKILNTSRSGGFTLVELILVIIILGIVSIGTVQYLSLGAQIYAEATERDEAVAQSRFMLARLTRELRHAAPNSVRLSCSVDNLACSVNQCLEFVPFKASTIYTGNITDNPIIIVDPQNTAAPNDWLNVYALNANDVYDTSNNKRVQLRTISDGTPASVDNWTINPSLATESPTKRVYVLEQPVSFCIVSSQLFRYEGYAFSTNQNTPNASNEIGGIKGVLLGELIQNSISKTAFFSYNTASLTRNSVVNIRSEMGFNDSETVSFNHEIHLPNVP